MAMIYLDHNATTQVLDEVREAMWPWLGEHYGNPSSVHRAGRLARQAIDTAREQVAALVGAEPGEVIFTSGGTEANNLALRTALAGRRPRRLLVGATEHAAVLEPAEALVAGQGLTLAHLPVDAQGRVAPETLEAALADGTPTLLSLMWANNETGVIQDIETLGAQAQAAGALVHSDAVQAAGKLPLNFAAAPVDLLSLSAHKINGPKGVGALIHRRGVELPPLVIGGGQEAKLRGGTENLAGIVGFGAAAAAARRELEARRERSKALRQRLEDGLMTLPGVVIYGREAPRVANTCQFTVAGYESEALLMALDREGIAVSSGSACHSGSGEPTHVLLAMGVDRDTAYGSIRASLGVGNTAADVDAFLQALQRLLSPSRPAFATDLFVS